MTVEEKIDVLCGIFRQNSNQEVLSWESIPGGYRWVCANSAASLRLARLLTSHLDLLHLNSETFPYRVDPDSGTILIFEPIAD